MLRDEVMKTQLRSADSRVYLTPPPRTSPANAISASADFNK